MTVSATSADVILAARKLSRCLSDAKHDECPITPCASCVAALNAAIDALDCAMVAEAASALLSRTSAR